MGARDDRQNKELKILNLMIDFNIGHIPSFRVVKGVSHGSD
jgi:hypothetical protein